MKNLIKNKQVGFRVLRKDLEGEWFTFAFVDIGERMYVR